MITTRSLATFFTRAFFIFALPVLVLPVSFVRAAGFSGTGSGTEGSPYVITSCEQLQEMDDSLDADFVLDNDIDCSMTNPDDEDFDEMGTWGDSKGFAPIGSVTLSGMNIYGGFTYQNFTGNLDGQNHVITDLYINRGADSNDVEGYYVGLFGTIAAGASVENLGLENVDITGSGNNVGALAGGLSGTATSVYSTGSVIGRDRTGGLVGVHVDSNSFPNSSPLVYTWNGSAYVYTDDVGELLPKGLSGVDYAQINSEDLAPKDGTYSIKVSEEYNEIVYFDEMALMTFDHEPGYSIVEPLTRTSGEEDLRTVSDTPTNPLLGCVDNEGEDCTDALKANDNKWSYTNENGHYDTKNLKKYWVLDFGDLSDASSIQLVMRGARDYAASAEYPGNSARSIQVKDESGNWVEVYNKNELSSDGTPRLRTVDLTEKFLSNDHHVKVIFDTFNANYFAVDTSAQVPFTTHTYHPDSASLDYHGFTAVDTTHFYDHDYDTVSPVPHDIFKNQYGNFTKYGDVTPLLTEGDDHSVVMRYGDQISVDFPYVAPAEGTERSFILFNDALYKHATYQNLGAYGQDANYLPYHGMTSYGPGMDAYPMTPENAEYRTTWNTRTYEGPFADALRTGGSTIIDSYSTANVEGNWDVGGLVGFNRKEIRNSYATGAVHAYGESGGLVGLNSDTGWIHDAYATGDQDDSNYYVGGFVGLNYGKIERAYSSGTLTLGDNHFGGFVGIDAANDPDGIFDSFTVSDFTGSSGATVGGFAATGGSIDYVDARDYWFNNQTIGVNDDREVQPIKVDSADYFKGTDSVPPFENSWDFDTIWARVSDGLPVFQWQDPEPISTYTLTYTAGTGGSVTGTLSQTVDEGEDGAAVTAVPDSGYHFTEWSDSSTDNPRTDVEVIEDVTVEAHFEKTASVHSSRSGGGSIAHVTPPSVPGQLPVSVINANRDLFTKAHEAGITLPDYILTQLGLGGPSSAASAIEGVRDLDMGMSGSDVTALQALLLAQGYIIPAGATGYFAGQTRAALAEYQKAHSIAPAVGYFGVKTRAQMKSANLSGLWW